jgi:hypothetical protein
MTGNNGVLTMALEWQEDLATGIETIDALQSWIFLYRASVTTPTSTDEFC